jgi:hypothetical protein
MFVYSVPDYFLRHLGSPYRAVAADTSENAPPCETGRIWPVIDGLLHPARHGDGAHMPSLSDQVHDGPMVFAVLKAIKREIASQRSSLNQSVT